MGLDQFLQFFVDLKNSPGETVQERAANFLARRGWDRHVDLIPDEQCRLFLLRCIESNALRHEAPRDARNSERDRHRKETRKIAETGMLGDFFKDQYVGLEPEQLATKLPRETYWVESLGRHVPREELAFELEAVSELRKLTRLELSDLDEIANVYRHELAIFDELIRQSARRPQPA
jgi:hypothetical protein